MQIPQRMRKGIAAPTITAVPAEAREMTTMVPMMAERRAAIRRVDGFSIFLPFVGGVFLSLALCFNSTHYWGRGQVRKPGFLEKLLGKV